MVPLKRQQLCTKAKPHRVPDNVHFQIDDFEDEQWSWREEYFDYIHSRFLAGSVSSYPRFIRKAFKYELLLCRSRFKA